MAEYWFYHLESSSLEGVLPDLLGKTRSKGWRALVKLPEARLKDMDDYLWVYKDDDFLPHGRDDEPMADQQPILLSHSAETSEGVDCVFLIDGADITVSEATERCMVMINGREAAAVDAARAQWKKLKDSGAAMSYWQQDERGKWEKKA